MRREAGRRAIAQARARRREQSRRIGWRYIPGIAIYCLVASALIVYMAWTMGSNAAWFMCGAAVGASLLLLWIVVDSVEASRLEMGGYAEQFTEDELRKLRRAGWRVTSNIPFENCDVDPRRHWSGRGGCPRDEMDVWSTVHEAWPAHQPRQSCARPGRIEQGEDSSSPRARGLRTWRGRLHGRRMGHEGARLPLPSSWSTRIDDRWRPTGHVPHVQAHTALAI